MLGVWMLTDTELHVISAGIEGASRCDAGGLSVAGAQAGIMTIEVIRAARVG
jgi:hypothetical protein